MMTRTNAAALAVGLLAISWAHAQPVQPPRAAQPLVLATLDAAPEIARWASNGDSKVSPSPTGHGLRWEVPQWAKGMYECPSVYVAYEGGQGYPVQDWSHYGKVAFDVSVEGIAPCDLALDLYDRPDSRGATARLVVPPGQILHAEVPLVDLSAEADLGDIGRIQFHLTRPERPATLTIANLRLLPGDKAPLAQIALLYPNYRGLVLPGAGPVRAEVRLNGAEYGVSPAECQIALTARAGGREATVRRSLARELSYLSLPVSGLPDGDVALQAVVSRKTDGQVLATDNWPLRKLSPAEASRLRVYIDAHNNTIVDGKPFFPLGFYSSGSDQYLAEIADSPFNCLLDYSTNSKPRQAMRQYLDTMQRRGLKLIYCLNDVYPTATYLDGKTWEGVKGNEAIAAAVVKAYRDHPALLAWYLNDELPRHLEPDLRGYYHRIRTADPNHPCYIVLCDMAELGYFVQTTDVMGVDPYPIPGGQVSMVSSWMEAANAATRGRMPTWLVPQAFAWYQHFPENENTDRGKPPTADELARGRAPNYEEERCMTYLALAHGAKGLVYWCYYDMRVLPQYNEMWGWMKKLGAEVKALSPVLLSAADLGPVRCTPANAAVHTKLKRHAGRLYLIAVNAEQSPCQVTFDLRRGLPAQVEVMFEGVKAATNGTRLTADFKPLEVHVYDLGMAGSERAFSDEATQR
jgi:hypothetical protein